MLKHPLLMALGMLLPLWLCAMLWGATHAEGAVRALRKYRITTAKDCRTMTGIAHSLGLHIVEKDYLNGSCLLAVMGEVHQVRQLDAAVEDMAATIGYAHAQ